MVIAFCITAIKVLIGRLFSTVIMYKIINQLRSTIIGDAFNQVYVLLASIGVEKANKTEYQYGKVCLKKIRSLLLF